MKKIILTLLAIAIMINITGCDVSQTRKDAKVVNQQQKQYAIGQPIPSFNFSLARKNVIDIYKLQNKQFSSHTVWRSDYGMVEGDCTSMGYSIPYDVSLTNPLKRINSKHGNVVVEQAEPNGLFSSKNTNATWVLCLGEAGKLDPVYTESKVTVYPYEVSVNYETNRVKKIGKSNASITK